MGIFRHRIAIGPKTGGPFEEIEAMVDIISSPLP